MNGYVTSFFFAVVCLAQGQAPVKKPDDDLAKLQGTWKVISCENNGRINTNTANLRYVYDKEIVTETSEGHLATRCSFKLDSSKKPKTIELTILENSLIASSKGSKIPVIYEWEGERLKVCYPPLNPLFPTQFPKDFTTKGDNGRTVLILEKVKPEPAR
jgi:uncharacterized protein (TIGR03067 family)